MLIQKIRLASRVGYLRFFGKRSDIRSDYDIAAESYDSYYSKNLIRASQPFIDKVPVSEGTLIVDLACGTGFFSHILAERVGSTGKVIAADISTGMLNQNRLGASSKGLTNIDLIERDAITLLREQSDSSVNVVNIGWGICYMDHNLLKAEISRVLKPGGVLSIIENKASTLYEVSKHFEHVLTKHPRALCKHMDVTLPRDSAYLQETFATSMNMTTIACYDGEVDVPCSSGSEIANYMIRSGASSGFLDSLDPNQIDSVMQTFIQEADARVGHGKSLPEVVHEYCVLIATSS